jgi:hypothetical protein
MGAIIKCVGLAGNVINVINDDKPDGMYLASFDVDAFEGRGTSAWAKDRYDAMIFMDFAAAHAHWSQQSTVLPFRPDGRPNKPLTAFTVEIEKLTDHEVFDLMFDGYVALKGKHVADGTLDVPFIVHYAAEEFLITMWLPSRDDLETSLARMLVEHGPPAWLVFLSDTWFKDFSDAPPTGPLEKGMLEQAFREGDFSVKEQLVMMAMGLDHELYSRNMEYRILDDDTIECHEPKDRPDHTEGQLVHVMHRILGLNELKDRQELFAFLRNLLSQEVDDNL